MAFIWFAGRGARLDRRSAGQVQGPQAADRGILDRSGSLCQHCPRGMVSIDLVGFSGAPPSRPRRPLHLHHTDPGGGQGAGDAGAVAGRAFHPDPLDQTIRGQKFDRAGIPAGIGGELGITDDLANRGQHRDMNGVGVRVDTANHLNYCCHDGASLSA